MIPPHEQKKQKHAHLVREKREDDQEALKENRMEIVQTEAFF
jgi:hypothetical protein